MIWSQTVVFPEAVPPAVVSRPICCVMGIHCVLLAVWGLPATPMKKGICLPKLALALDGEAGVPRDVLDTSLRFIDGSVFILSPINLLTSEAAR